MVTSLNIGLENFDIDASIDKVSYVSIVAENVKNILTEKFKEIHVKQGVRIYKDRINFSCPYCGDSVKNYYKKRGNIILDGKFSGFYKCHNCGEAKRVDRFFKDFNKTLDLSVINYISENVSDFSNYGNYKYDISVFFNTDIIDKYSICREELKKRFGLIEVKNSKIYTWLRNRRQFNELKFLYNDKQNYLVILNLTNNGKVLGLQKRNFSGNEKYITYKLSKLYEIMKIPFPESQEIIDELDTISQIFNICLLNFTQPIILVEGPMDSFLLKNCVANLGVNKRLMVDLPVKYLYDKDKIGTEKSIEHINLGDEVFLWEKYLRDINAPYRKKWDINDIFIWAYKNNIKLPNVLSYFSKDSLDIIDI